MEVLVSRVRKQRGALTVALAGQPTQPVRPLRVPHGALGLIRQFTHSEALRRKALCGGQHTVPPRQQRLRHPAIAAAAEDLRP